jgi:hypothetical protein
MKNIFEDYSLSVRNSLTSGITEQDFLLPRSEPEFGQTSKNYEEFFARDIEFGHFKPFQFTEECTSYGFKNQPKPWLPQAVRSKIEKMKRTPLRNKELVCLLQEIAEISIDFYSVKPGHSIAIGLDGKIVESAESEFELLLKIQGKKFSVPIFVWKVGSNSFAGWNAWQR